jgi:DNA topoisomerase-1
MSKTLVIVESPGKISKISNFLGSDYIVKASYGHVQDLDKNTLSIEIENNFKPIYIVSPDKAKVVKELKALAKDCKEVILASDGDREGEAIAYSLASVLKLTEPRRIVFNEITKNAILNAVKSPTTINNNMVNAQQARRLLDRLVGYQISPVLWKYIAFNGNAQSAGRVQSVAVRVLIDKEKEIEQSISNSYFKTMGFFNFNENNISSTLMLNNKMYHFENVESIDEFIIQIHKNTQYKVVSVENKKSIRKPSPPFITSTLQQEASTKLHFSVKKTMEVAQKLYEAGLITYMRSDSPNISNQAIQEAEKYIVETWGDEYSEPKNYASKNSTSQDAHECVRPTHLDEPEPENLEGDQKRLYSLIWKRTIASQMSNAQVNIQTISIDALNNKETLLNFDNEQCYFVSNLENVEFPGYMIVYDNSSDDEEKVVGKLPIKPKDLLSYVKLTISEEYTKPPLRYNEASLVKYLEKNGIGRPSTYASIISKIIDRNYVEIKNIEGAKKMSRIWELNHKLSLKVSEKEVFIGKEQKKMVPTHMGKIVNEFMMKNFEPIMDIKFTANFESFLDKIAEGKANWVTVLRNFHDTFYPIVDKLNSDAKDKKEKIGSSTDKLLGKTSSGKEVYAGTGKYGPYVKIKDENDKWKYAPLKEIKLEDVKLEDAVSLLEYPRFLGKIGNAIITLNKGQYGYYIKSGDRNISIKDEEIEPENIDIEYAKQLLEAGDPYAIKSFKLQGKVLSIKNGDYGPYIQILVGTKKQFISIPKTYKIENMTIDDVLKIIAEKNGTSKSTNKNKYPNKK